MQRAYQLVPVKSRHAVILDYSKTEYIAKHINCSMALLNHGILRFPSEWKLLLERIQQLVLNQHYTQALLLNIDALKMHVGAGRLWSQYIHIVHQYVNHSFNQSITLEAHYLTISLTISFNHS